MIKKFFSLIFIYIAVSSNSLSNENITSDLKNGGKIIFIRHALAPGGGDPAGFKLDDCNTQRNLNKEGIKQSKKIGFFFYKNKIPIDRVLSSEWCRCQDTAKHAFKKYTTFTPLNSFFDERFRKNKDRQIVELLNYLKNWKSEKNLILITHYVVILEIADKAVSSGEIVVMDKELNLIGSINEY
tara:strand:- start:32 stop:583 length:552 start_codon:yes stop_codon:yes gene_type:complete